MPILKNQKHERFAQLVATGMSATEAYRRVYKTTVKVAGSAGGRLLKNVGIQQRLTELQQKAAEGAVMTLQEMLEFLARVRRTPIGEVDERSDLCQSAEYTEDGRKFKMPDKLRAVELSAKLQGLFKEKVEVSVDGLGELLKAIRGGK